MLPQGSKPAFGTNVIKTVQEFESMVLEKNVDIPLKDGDGLCRGNVYKPKGQGPWPVIMTCEHLKPVTVKLNPPRRPIWQRHTL